MIEWLVFYMSSIEFGSLEELYARILPALNSKRRMMLKNGFKSIKKRDIWDYLRYNKWNEIYGLELCDMVNDILNTDDELIVEYCHRKNNKDLSGVEFDLPKLK